MACMACMAGAGPTHVKTAKVMKAAMGVTANTMVELSALMRAMLRRHPSSLERMRRSASVKWSSQPSTFMARAPCRGQGAAEGPNQRQRHM